MAFATEIAWVRLLVGDPSDGSNNPNPAARATSTPQISDANIQNFLDTYSDSVYTARIRVYYTAAEVLRSFAALAMERSIQASVGGTWTHDSRKLHDNYLKMAKVLEDQAQGSAAIGVAEMNWGANEEQIIENQVMRERIL